jgi:hypothetical protein
MSWSSGKELDYGVATVGFGNEQGQLAPGI